MKQLKSQDIKIVMGDHNWKVGSEKTENIIGPFGLGEKMKDETDSLNFARNTTLQ